MTANVQELVLVGFGVFACSIALGMAVATMRGTRLLSEARRKLQESEELNRSNGIVRLPVADGQTIYKGAMVSLDGCGNAGVIGTAVAIDEQGEDPQTPREPSIRIIAGEDIAPAALVFIRNDGLLYAWREWNGPPSGSAGERIKRGDLVDIDHRGHAWAADPRTVASCPGGTNG